MKLNIHSELINRKYLAELYGKIPVSSFLNKLGQHGRNKAFTEDEEAELSTLIINELKKVKK